MAGLKLVQNNNTAVDSEAQSGTDALVIDPTTGRSPFESEQKKSMFISAEEADINSQLSAGAEMLIITRDP